MAADWRGSVQQNIAQRGRRNNNCFNANTLVIAATGSRLEGHCADQEISRNEYTQVKGGGASANGGTGGDFDAQQIAQSGRQNNNCASPNYFFGYTASDDECSGGGHLVDLGPVAPGGSVKRTV